VNFKNSKGKRRRHFSSPLIALQPKVYHFGREESVETMARECQEGDASNDNAQSQFKLDKTAFPPLSGSKISPSTARRRGARGRSGRCHQRKQRSLENKVAKCNLDVSLKERKELHNVDDKFPAPSPPSQATPLSEKSSNGGKIEINENVQLQTFPVIQKGLNDHKERNGAKPSESEEVKFQLQAQVEAPAQAKAQKNRHTQDHRTAKPAANIRTEVKPVDEGKVNCQDFEKLSENVPRTKWVWGPNDIWLIEKDSRPDPAVVKEGHEVHLLPLKLRWELGLNKWPVTVGKFYPGEVSKEEMRKIDEEAAGEADTIAFKTKTMTNTKKREAYGGRIEVKCNNSWTPALTAGFCKSMKKVLDGVKLYH